MSDIKLTKDGIEYEPIEPTYRGEVVCVVFGGKTYHFKPIKKEKDIPKPYWKVLRYNFKEIIVPADSSDINNVQYCLNHGYKIHSIIRLTDNEIFTLGDEIKNGKIKIFFILETKIFMETDRCNYLSLEYQEKVKPKVPLFTTEDGVGIFDNDGYFKLYSDFTFSFYNASYGGLYPKDYVEKTFSKRKKLDEYILLNKPIEVSFKEISEIVIGTMGWTDEIIIRDIKAFFKSKINL